MDGMKIYQLNAYTWRGDHMKISKDECDKDFAEKKLELSEEKCGQCEYCYLCPYMARAMNDVVEGD